MTSVVNTLDQPCAFVIDNAPYHTGNNSNGDFLW